MGTELGYEHGSGNVGLLVGADRTVVFSGAFAELDRRYNYRIVGGFHQMKWA